MRKRLARALLLTAAGVALIDKEWPSDADGVNVLAKAWFLTAFNGEALSMHFDIFMTVRPRGRAIGPRQAGSRPRD